MPSLKRFPKKRAPWHGKPPVVAQNVKRHRLARKGLGTLDEAQAQRAIDEAIAQGKLRRII